MNTPEGCASHTRDEADEAHTLALLVRGPMRRSLRTTVIMDVLWFAAAASAAASTVAIVHFGGGANPRRSQRCSIGCQHAVRRPPSIWKRVCGSHGRKRSETVRSHVAKEPDAMCWILTSHEAVVVVVVVES